MLFRTVFGALGLHCRTCVDLLKCFGQVERVTHEAKEVLAKILVRQLQTRLESHTKLLGLGGGQGLSDGHFEATLLHLLLTMTAHECTV